MTALPASHWPGSIAAPSRKNANALSPQSVNGRHFQLAFAFPATLEAISPTRNELSELLCASGLAGIADTVVLAAHELMANAVRHGCYGLPPDTAINMTATCNGQYVGIRVQDPSSEMPCVRTGTSDQVDGRGLLLVDALADRWGVDMPSNGVPGKTVWIELDCPVGHTEAS